MRGGRRAGAGAPKKPPHLKKNPVNVKLQQWIIDQLRELTAATGKSRAVLIEDAVVDFYKISARKPPAEDGGVPPTNQSS